MDGIDNGPADIPESNADSKRDMLEVYGEKTGRMDTKKQLDKEISLPTDRFLIIASYGHPSNLRLVKPIAAVPSRICRLVSRFQSLCLKFPYDNINGTSWVSTSLSRAWPS